ncbi:hypothetical protein [Phyllobacterium calauticae]|jgi:hypothetical protein|uniref:hypothetical protein n=1 Tax=Phyllobacterium calauticae TaxID=2817027 RepID=UPI001CC17AB9|nr:hypothetical protein [Phyllobacterium calauticae]MBZ3695518.1 hypothetical protein [Phyllobacterium calauticae]
MGDRCYLTLTLHGRIETVAALELIVLSLRTHGMRNETVDGDHCQEFAAALRNASNPAFSFEECFADDVAPIEDVLQSISLPYRVEHGGGDDYPATRWSWTREQGRVFAIQASGYGDVVESSALHAALGEPDPLGAVRTLFDKSVVASGFYLPDFSAAPSVLHHLGVLEEVGTC